MTAQFVPSMFLSIKAGKSHDALMNECLCLSFYETNTCFMGKENKFITDIRNELR